MTGKQRHLASDDPELRATTAPWCTIGIRSALDGTRGVSRIREFGETCDDLRLGSTQIEVNDGARPVVEGQDRIPFFRRLRFMARATSIKRPLASRRTPTNAVNVLIWSSDMAPPS